MTYQQQLVHWQWIYVLHGCKSQCSSNKVQKSKKKKQSFMVNVILWVISSSYSFPQQAT